MESNIDLLCHEENKESISTLSKDEIERCYKSCLFAQTSWYFVQMLTALIVMSVCCRHMLKKEENICIPRLCLAAGSCVGFAVARRKTKRYTAEVFKYQKVIDK